MELKMITNSIALDKTISSSPACQSEMKTKTIRHQERSATAWWRFRHLRASPFERQIDLASMILLGLALKRIG